MLLAKESVVWSVRREGRFEQRRRLPRLIVSFQSRMLIGLIGNEEQHGPTEGADMIN